MRKNKRVKKKKYLGNSVWSKPVPIIRYAEGYSLSVVLRHTNRLRGVNKWRKHRAKEGFTE